MYSAYYSKLNKDYLRSLAEVRPGMGRLIMPMRPVSFFTAAYVEKSLQVRKKSRILATINLIFGSVSVLFAILMSITKSVVPSFVFMGLVVFCAVVLAMLRAGKYHAASSVFLYGVFAAMFIAIKFGDHPLEVYNSYVMGTLGGFLLVVASLVADRAVQPIVIGLLNLVSIEAIYWTGTFPSDNHSLRRWPSRICRWHPS